MTNHSAFLSYVQNYVKDNPDVSPYVSDHVARGLNSYLLDVMERATDMEVALSACIAQRFKGRNDFILSKLKKWNGRSALQWDGTIEMMEKLT